MDLTTTVGYVPGFVKELNLRELGGLPTTDGRRVRRGLFYRGSTLANLSEEERGLVDAMGLRYLLDLRAAGEAEERDDYVPDGCVYERIGGMYFPDGSEVDFSPKMIPDLVEKYAEQMASGSFMRDLYVGMAFGNKAMNALVQRVLEGELPVYFHCSAGKDRTGLAAMTIGLLLGVTREALLEDFLLTNEYRRSIIEGVARKLPPGTPQDVIEGRQKANGVQAENLLAVFEAIDERYATTDDYLQAEFGIDADGLRALRDRYLE